MRTRLAVDPLEPREVPAAAAFQTLPVLPFSDPAVLDHARAIFALGQQLGRRSDVFLKLGDSNTAGPPTGPVTYLAPLGQPGYDPFASGLAATHPELLDTWQAFRDPVDASGVNSFTRVGPGAHANWFISNVLSALPSEIAATDAGVALVMIGTNDVGWYDNPGVFRAQLTQLVSAIVGSGVLPVLSTIPDMAAQLAYLKPQIAAYNQVIADVAADDRLPLWNTWAALQPLPGEGIGSDGVHLNSSPAGSANFGPADLQYGQNVRNLEALQILDWFRDTVAAGPTYIAPSATWQPLAAGGSYYAVGRDVGFSPAVDVFDAATGGRVDRFLAFGANFGGGVHVATGDVNGDGFTDVVCATGAGAVAKVKVFSGRDGSVLTSLAPFGRAYRGGLAVAVGDLDADGVADVAVGKLAGSSGVRVYAGGTFTLTAAFRAFPRMAGGVSLAVTHVAGQSELAVGSAASPVVRLFDASGSLVSSFHALPGSGFGVTVAAADLDGDGSDELAVARVTGGNTVTVLDPQTQAVRATFTVGPVVDPSFGIRLGTLRSPAGGSDTLLVGSGPGSPVSLRAFSDLTGTAVELPPTNPNRAFGIFVG